jgi:DegV family protein with EDD domain
MSIKFVSDSSANLYSLEGVDFKSADMVISTDEKEYRDNENLDVKQMVDELAAYKGRSGTACPGVGEWLDSFGDAEEVYCTTITAQLSGSYNSAMSAKEQYEEEHPGRKVLVFDSRSAGPEMKLILEKMREFVQSEMDFDTISKKIAEYKEKTSIAFCLESVRNLANNGRINPAVAAMLGMLGIRIIGDATGGVLNPTDKVRGDKKAIAKLVENMKKAGYVGKKVYIDHCYNEAAAEALKKALLAEFPNAIIKIALTTGLCSFYAEKGGLMIGFEH